jgi:hypothetical protein
MCGNSSNQQATHYIGERWKSLNRDDLADAKYESKMGRIVPRKKSDPEDTVKKVKRQASYGMHGGCASN